MQRLFLLVAVMLLSGCLTAPPKEAARPTLMPRAQSYKDLTHLPAPTGKIFVSVYNIQDETGQFKPYPASNFSTAVPQSATAMLVTALKDSRWFIPLERQGLQNLLNERKIIRAAQENGTVAINNRIPLQSLTAANIMVEGSIIGYESNVCVFHSIRSRIGIEVRSAIRIHSINRELNFFYRFLTRFFAAFH
ncbi:CsgG/HfaB family protein, partial [Escherichia coli]|uniref:CsgG/HfaB family protein n=1 Tax=Escherichia coli TaxID=562 RepID=UPI003D192AEC